MENNTQNNIRYGKCLCCLLQYFSIFFCQLLGADTLLWGPGSLLIGLLCIVRSCSQHSMVAARLTLEWPGSITSFKSIYCLGVK